MKKNRLITLILSCFLLAGCTEGNKPDKPKEDPKPEEHTHTWAENWSKDEQYHWRVCTGTVTTGTGEEAKTEKCTEVNEKAEHTWDAGTVTKEATTREKGLKTLKCTVCEKTKTEEIPIKTDVPQGTFTVTTNLSETKEIHTANQKKFLTLDSGNYDYYNITSSKMTECGMTGKQETSFPQAISLAWDHTPVAGKTLDKYIIKIGTKEDLSDAMFVEVGASKSTSLYNAFIGTNYFQILASYKDGYEEKSETKTLLVDSQGPRNLKVGNMSNCRDAGGWTTTSGAKIRQGLLFRTSDPANGDTTAKNLLLKQFGIKTEIYVKDGGSADGSQSPIGAGVTYYNCNMDYGTASYSNLSRNGQRLRRVFTFLADEKNYPIVYHCRIGSDRTGLVGMLSNGVMGLPFQDCMRDYLFSSFAKIDGQRYPNMAKYTTDTNGDDPAKYIDEILSLPGDNFQQQCYNALRLIGVTDAQIQSFLNIMLDGPKPTNNKGQIFGTADEFTLAGAKLTKQTNDDFKNPISYATLSGTSNSVSFKANIPTAQEYTVAIYLGHNSKSSSKKLSDAITVKVGENSLTVPAKTYEKAGFGNPGGRTAYMFNVIDKFSFAAGEQTITITGKNSDSFNISCIALIPGTVPAKGI